jgi:hypothetical protein
MGSRVAAAGARQSGEQRVRDEAPAPAASGAPLALRRPIGLLFGPSDQAAVLALLGGICALVLAGTTAAAIS